VEQLSKATRNQLGFGFQRMSDYIGKKRIAYLSFDGHTDFLEAVRIHNGWEWSIYDGELGRIVGSGRTGVKAIDARRDAEAKWRKYRNASVGLPVIKWRY
jgi:hypothetical protein